MTKDSVSLSFEPSEEERFVARIEEYRKKPFNPTDGSWAFMFPIWSEVKNSPVETLQ